MSTYLVKVAYDEEGFNVTNSRVDGMTLEALKARAWSVFNDNHGMDKNGELVHSIRIMNTDMKVVWEFEV